MCQVVKQVIIINTLQGWWLDPQLLLPLCVGSVLEQDSELQIDPDV